MTIHELHTTDGLLLIDDLGGTISGCRLGETWVMPDTRDVREYASGEQLFPWPNRVRDGRWRDGDVLRELPINEPSRHTAIHGLLHDVPLSNARSSDSLSLSGTLPPSAGYPWEIDCELRFTLGPGTLTAAARFSNRSARPAPWAFGVHPYLCLPDPAKFTLNAERVWQTDEQLIPTHVEAVSGQFDRRSPTELGSFELDHAFERRAGSRVIASLATAEQSLDCWADEAFGYVQVFTPPADSRLHAHGRTIAVEPMTALADAFNSGIGLRQLAPGETVELSWGLELGAR